MEDKEAYPDCLGLLPKLEKEQAKKGWISEQALKRISKETGIPISRVYGVATFYAHLHTEKQGKYIIEICNSPSCYLNSSLNLIKFIEKELKIKSGQTTKNGKFSIHICSCIGCCDKAPAMMINKKVYGNLTEEKVKKILKKCR
ncbi:NADH-quinone oxidoreductase subunit NuoE [Candidatus Woesearchaeota archaeon]|nr:NADH-quinone oxidoreductase subunit NuoE [Candidatus Woesearchaeota archaeon]